MPVADEPEIQPTSQKSPITPSYQSDSSNVVNHLAQRIKGYFANEITGQHFSRRNIEAQRSAPLGLPQRALETEAREAGSNARAGASARTAQHSGLTLLLIDAIRRDNERPRRLYQDHPRHHRNAAKAQQKLGAPAKPSRNRRRRTPSASSPEASPTTSVNLLDGGARQA